MLYNLYIYTKLDPEPNKSIFLTCDEVVDLVSENPFLEDTVKAVVCAPRIQYELGNTHVDPNGPAIFGFKCQFSSHRVNEVLKERNIDLPVETIKNIVV